MKKGNAPTRQQSHITDLLADRFRKPRPFASDPEPPTKRQKLDNPQPPRTPGANVAPSPDRNSIQSQKKKWRLSEIVKKDRESRRLRASTEPSFVFTPPATAQPIAAATPAPGTVATPSRADRASTKPVRSPATKRSAPDKTPAPSEPTKVALNAPPEASVRTPKHSRLSVGDALLYDRDMLPASHGVLLDSLLGLESAMALLRVRRTSPTLAATRPIVQATSRRDFSPRILSQLAHIVPECIAVLPPFSRTTCNVDGLRVRLDDPSQPGDGGTSSVLGDSFARLRRSLLHKRLLEHVREAHERFLERTGITRYDVVTWHEDFDLEGDVEDLPSPPLYPELLASSKKSRKNNCTDANDPASRDISAPAEQHSLTTLTDVGASVETACALTSQAQNASQADANVEKTDSSDEDGEKDCGIPKGLLARVRAREKAREVHDEKADDEKRTNRSMLSKLPVTMDTVHTVLRTERRFAMGWRQLVNKVVTLHPRKWPREDIEQQVEAIVKLGGVWCSKVELKSAGGGFAFRVVSDKTFAEARSAVSRTESLTME